MPRNVSSSSTEGGGGKGGGSEAASISGKERRRWITPKPRSEEEEENGEENVDGKKEKKKNQKNQRKEDSYLDEALISLFASRLAKFLNEGEEEEDFFNEEKGGVDFKRDVANRCVRAVTGASQTGPKAKRLADVTSDA